MARISQFDRFRTQMAVLVPLTRALREKLGQEAADALVAEVLDEIARKQAAKQVADGQTMTVAKLQAGMRAFSADDALEYEELSDDDGAYDFDVRRCRYSEHMEALGARDLGPLLVCRSDIPAAEAMHIDLERSQTLMTGAPCCDFRYRLRGDDAS